MQKTATITSKKQLTIPARVYEEAGFKYGQKVLVTVENGKMIVYPAELLIERLAGSLKTPESWRGKDTKDIISQAKEKYFAEGRK